MEVRSVWNGSYFPKQLISIFDGMQNTISDLWGKPVFILFKSNSLWSKIFGLGIHHNRFKQSIIIIRISTQVRIEGHILKSRWQFIIKRKESRCIMLIFLHKFRFMFSWFQDVHNGKTGVMIGNHGINNTWEYKLFRVLQFTVDWIN